MVSIDPERKRHGPAYAVDEIMKQEQAFTSTLGSDQPIIGVGVRPNLPNEPSE
jgi:hypothetical protein